MKLIKHISEGSYKSKRDPAKAPSTSVAASSVIAMTEVPRSR